MSDSVNKNAFTSGKLPEIFLSNFFICPKGLGTNPSSYSSVVELSDPFTKKKKFHALEIQIILKTFTESALKGFHPLT